MFGPASSPNVLGAKNSFVGEFLTKNKHSGEKPFFPNIRLLGCKKGCKKVVKTCQ